uniref:Uncharacterized protein n=1 Tax=Oryza glumipatula TaxID=40148 RepID=A0A0D9ZVK5_9ORYZ
MAAAQPEVGRARPFLSRGIVESAINGIDFVRPDQTLAPSPVSPAAWCTHGAASPFYAATPSPLAAASPFFLCARRRRCILALLQPSSP